METDSCDSLISEIRDWVDTSTNILKHSEYYDSVIQYTRYAYYFINLGFRNNNLSRHALTLYNDITNAFNIVPALPKNITVYRGVDVHDNIDELPIGSVIHNKGFLSTTLDRKLSLSFSPADSVIQYVIHIPDGVKLLFLHKSYGTSKFDQCELVLPLNSVFRIDNKSSTVKTLPTRKVKDTLLEVTLVGFDTPSADQILNMYDQSIDILANKIIQSYNTNYVTIFNTTIIKSITNISYIYYLISKLKGKAVYITNIPLPVYTDIMENNEIKFTNSDRTFTSKNMFDFYLSKRRMKTYFYNSVEYPVEYTLY